MSESSPNTPRSSNASFDGGDASSGNGNGSSTRRITRTVALIKRHALEHRMDIERRVEEAGFEITKERQMEFTAESDQEYLHELFGDDTPALFEGPIWIYVLARRRAVSVFRTLMGPADPALAREQSPTSLRALYGGASVERNAVGAARDEATAEEMIAALFESSPPFEPTDVGADEEVEGLALDGVGGGDREGEYEVERAVNGGLGYDDYENEHDALDDPERAQAFLSPTSSQTRSSTNNSYSNGLADGIKARTNSGIVPLGANPHFKARPLPKSTRAPPASQPRTTRAAALRSGELVIAPTPFKDRHKELKKVAPTREEQKQAFLDVPGHKRSVTIAVASTAPPTLAPRMTRAASLRIAGGPTTVVKRPAPRPSIVTAGARKKSDENANKAKREEEAKARRIFEGVPGHKRRESISVASVRAPSVAPRLNKSAELRAKKEGEGGPPSSYMFRAPSIPKVPQTSTSTISTSTPALSRAPSSFTLTNGTSNSNCSPSRPRSSSSLALSSPSRSQSQSLNSPPATLSRASSSLALQHPHPPRPPSIEPRQNRSALLRAAKKVDSSAATTNGGGGKPLILKENLKKASHPPVSMKMKNITNNASAAATTRGALTA